MDITPHHLKKRQTASYAFIFEFQIVTDFDTTNMTNDQQFTFVDGIQLDGIVPAIIDNCRNGDYDHLDYGALAEDEIAFADYRSPYCDPGSVSVRATKCSKSSTVVDILARFYVACEEKSVYLL